MLLVAIFTFQCYTICGCSKSFAIAVDSALAVDLHLAHVAIPDQHRLIVDMLR